MVTIILTVSRGEFLNRVITALELLECDQSQVNILCVVDGNDELFIRTRNQISDMKYRERLTVKFPAEGSPSRYSIPERRKRIAAIHNYARTMIGDDTEYVLLVEDDTTFGRFALKKLMKIAVSSRAVGFVEGVELGRWGVPYVGAWEVDDLYDPKVLKSIENINPVHANQEPSQIDAGGLYCTLARADLYKQHTFIGDNGLGPDINFGLENRQLGFQGYIAWNVPCRHYSLEIPEPGYIDPSQPSRQVTMQKLNDKKWSVTY